MRIYLIIRRGWSFGFRRLIRRLINAYRKKAVTYETSYRPSGLLLGTSDY